jgi:hypothetical protein
MKFKFEVQHCRVDLCCPCVMSIKYAEVLFIFHTSHDLKFNPYYLDLMVVLASLYNT